MRTFVQDLRYGLRLLRRQPGFSLVAVLVLGLGIGANTTIFSLVNVLALKPRVGDVDRLVSLYSRDRVEPDTYRGFSFPNFADLRSRTDVFAALAAHTPVVVGVTENDATRRAFVDVVTADYFTTFNAPLAAGRGFTADEERPGADVPVTVISHQMAQRLGGAASAIGSQVRINQRDFTVIGVAAPGFGGTSAMIAWELFLPTGVYDTISNDFMRDGLPAQLASRTHHNLFLVGRLRDGLASTTAAPALDVVSRAMEQAYPVENKNQVLEVTPVSRLSISTNPEPDGMLSMLSAVLLSMSGVVLLIASLNLTNMLLARGGARRKEFAVRLAIGGSRLRLVRQLLTESLVLSLIGGAVALLLSTSALRLLVSQMEGRLPIQIAINPAPDWRVFAAMFAFAALATMLFGLGPGLSLARTRALPELKEAGGEMPVRRSRFAARHLLVMAQLAFSLALLTAGGLFVRGAAMGAALDPGFTFDRGVLAQIDGSLAGYNQAQSMDVYARAIERLRRVPGVSAVAAASLMPFGEIQETRGAQLPGPRVKPSDADAKANLINATNTVVTADYFTSLGLSLVRGRDFTAAEVASGGAPVAIIDENLARQLFSGADPVGRQLQLNNRDDSVAPDLVEIVGIAPPILQQMTDQQPGPSIYRPLAQDYRSGLTLHLWTTAGTPAAEAAMLPAVRQALREVDARLPVVTLETRPMFRDRNPMLWILRVAAAIFMAFGACALFMAALGIYGVKAYLVSRRTREIGIRMALGATARDVVRLVISDGLALTITGLIAGLGLSALVTTAIGSLLFQGTGFDAPVVGAAFATLLAASVLAAWLPARRATRIEPQSAIRVS